MVALNRMKMPEKWLIFQEKKNPFHDFIFREGYHIYFKCSSAEFDEFFEVVSECGHHHVFSCPTNNLGGVAMWNQLNARLLKWVNWEKGLYKMASVKYLQTKYKETPKLFAHWLLVYP